MNYIISVRNLNKIYKKKAAVESVSFDLKEGVILGLLGPNGAGKTTTLKMITNICTRTKGNVVIGGYSLDENPREAILQVGAALDSPYFYNELSAKENLLYCAKLYGDIPDSRLDELLEYVGLGKVGKKHVSGFSMGMKQRLALARTLIADPKLVILDEPANGLDPQGMIQLYDMIRNLSETRKTTFIVSSHLLHDMENLSTDILILNEGKSILQGKTIDLISGVSKIADIITPTPEFLIHLIKETKGLEFIRRQDRQVTIKIVKFTINNLLSIILEQGIIIDSFSMRKKSLEDLFLELTGGGIS